MGRIILHMKGNAYEMKLDKCHIVGQCINALNGVYHPLFNFCSIFITPGKGIRAIEICLQVV